MPWPSSVDQLKCRVWGLTLRWSGWRLESVSPHPLEIRRQWELGKSVCLFVLLEDTSLPYWWLPSAVLRTLEVEMACVSLKLYGPLSPVQRPVEWRWQREGTGMAASATVRIWESGGAECGRHEELSRFYNYGVINCEIWLKTQRWSQATGLWRYLGRWK